MTLSDERIAIANRAIRQAFERSSIAWQAVPHWDIGAPGQSAVRSDVTVTIKGMQSANDPPPVGPFGGKPLVLQSVHAEFRITLAQATASTPDALLGAVLPRATYLAKLVDDDVLAALSQKAIGENGEPWYRPLDVASPPTNKVDDVAEILSSLVRGRQVLEDSGFRAASCLIASTRHFTNLNQWAGSNVVTEGLLVGSNANSLHRSSRLDDFVVEFDANKQPKTKADLLIMLGRRQEIEHGCAGSASPGEEPADLAVSVMPSLEVIGERQDGLIELALHMRFATRVKDERGIVVFFNKLP